MEYKCNICKTQYSSYKSRWLHNYKYHKNNILETPQNNSQIPQNNSKTPQNNSKIYKCLKCSKILSRKDNLTRHEKICNNKLEINEILTEKEKLGILNNKCHSLRDLVKLVHISPKYKQFKNIYITNLQNTIAYKYDTKTNNFLAVNKSELLDDLIENRISDINYFHSELEEKVDDQTSEIIKRFINRMNDGDDNLKDIKKEEIKLLIYNHTKDIRKEIDSQMDEARIKEIDKLLEAPYVEEIEV